MSPADRTSVGIVGGGLGGLAASCTLAARGYAVSVFEGNDWTGGKAAPLAHDGFRFDMGPTILTVPLVLERIFREAECNMEDRLQLVRLNPQWRCFFEDGSVLDLVEDPAKMSKAVDELAPGTGKGYRRFIQLAERLHEISNRFFFWRPVEDLLDTVDIRQNLTPRTLSDVINLRMGTTVAGAIRKHVPDARVAQMLDHFTQYVGSSPFSAPAVLCAIAHMQTSEGVWYPMGGTRAVPEALERLARDLGVRFHMGKTVTRILHERDQVKGVETDAGERISFSAVISNMDSVRTYRELIGGEAERTFDKTRKYEPACSGVVLYLGLNRAYEHLLHHDFVFSSDPKEEFDYIYRRGEPAPDPTCYLAATARTDPSTAPEGGEALYVLVHTPYLRPHHDWSRMFPAYRRTIIDKLKRTAGLKDIEERIVFESSLTPPDIHERYKVLNGAIYGLASHGRFTGAFKPGNRSRLISGLYLAGGAAHPGPGMPMVLMSGWIAADALDRDMKRQERAA